jgi:hypothetical protein
LNQLGLGLNQLGLGLNCPGLGLNQFGLGLNLLGLGWNQWGLALNPLGLASGVQFESFLVKAIPMIEISIFEIVYRVALNVALIRPPRLYFFWDERSRLHVDAFLAKSAQVAKIFHSIYF